MSKYEYLKRMKEIANFLGNYLKDKGDDLCRFYFQAEEDFMKKINEMPLNYCNIKATEEDLKVLAKYEWKLRNLKAGVND